MDELYLIKKNDFGKKILEEINGNFTTIAGAVNGLESSFDTVLDVSKIDDPNILYDTENANIVKDKKQTSTRCLLTSPIKVLKGDVVKVRCCQYSDCAVISTTDENGTAYTHKVIGTTGYTISADSTPSDYQYTAESDGYVAVGWYKDNGIQLVINHVVSATIKRLYDMVSSIGNRFVFGSPSIYFSGDTGDENLTGKTVSDLYAAYDELCAAHPQMLRKDANLGMDASDTYEIRQYTLSMNTPYQINGEVFGDDLPATNPWNNDYDNKKIVAIATGCHGNEKNVTWGVYLAIKELLESSEQWAVYIKSNFVIKLLPCINPYGFQNVTRTNANSQDINRDIINQTQSESVAWKEFIDNNAANMVLYLDMHGTAGRCGYFEVLGNDKYFDEYCKAYYKFISAINASYKQYMGAAAYPYIYLCKSNYSGMTINYTNQLGIKGHIMETTGSYNQSVLSSKWCKMTKDLLINGIMLYAEP